MFSASSSSDVTAPSTPHMRKANLVNGNPNLVEKQPQQVEPDSTVIVDEKKEISEKKKRESRSDLFRYPLFTP